MFKVFIVEDDNKIADIIMERLTKSGYECRKAEKFNDIMDEFNDFKPNIVLLDIMLPFYDGYYWCGKIRMVSNVPIMFISSKSENMDIIVAANMGGDDFVTKPFSIDVLEAKITSLLRRTYSYDSSSINVISHKGLMMNVGDGSVSADGGHIELTKNEAKILAILLKNHGNVVSRERIMRSLWKDENFIDDNTLTVNINRLRKKLSEIGADNYIETKKNQGYIV